MNHKQMLHKEEIRNEKYRIKAKQCGCNILDYEIHHQYKKTESFLFWLALYGWFCFGLYVGIFLV